MSRYHLDRYLTLPSVRSRYSRDLLYIVGYYIGSNFRIVARKDTLELAVSYCLSLQANDCDCHDYHVYELRTEIFLVQ